MKRAMQDPELRAKALAAIQSPQARAKARRTITRRRLGWCPPERRDEYRRLCTMGFTAAEARRMIEDDIRRAKS